MGLGCGPRSLAEFPRAPGTKELLGEPEEGVWLPSGPFTTGPTCPSRRPPGHASCTFHSRASWSCQAFVYAASSAWYALSLIFFPPV